MPIENIIRILYNNKKNSSYEECFATAKGD